MIENGLKNAPEWEELMMIPLKTKVSNMGDKYLRGVYTIVPDDIDCHIDLEFGAYTSIASGLTIVSGQHPPVENPNVVSTFPFKEHGFGDQYPASKMDGKVVVGSDVWIGQNVTILEGVKIGHGSIIGAGSVVTKDVNHYSVVAGNPAEIIRYRFDAVTLSKLLADPWWDWPVEKVGRAFPHMHNIRGFLIWMENNSGD